MSEKIGVVTEQGDLGMGFNPITLREQEELRKKDEQEKENQK